MARLPYTRGIVKLSDQLVQLMKQEKELIEHVC